MFTGKPLPPGALQEAHGRWEDALARRLGVADYYVRLASIKPKNRDHRNELRKQMKDMMKKWLGVDAEVSAIARECDEIIRHEREREERERKEREP